MSNIQSVLFDKKYWSLPLARVWLYKHNLVPLKQAHITNKFIRYRIMDPKKFNRFRTIKIKNNIELIIGLR